MGHNDTTNEIFPHGYRFERGFMYLTDQPSLGVDFDESSVSTYPYQPAYLAVSRLTDGTLSNW